MAPNPPRPKDLVLTEAEPVPAAGHEARSNGATGTAPVDPDTLRDLQRLAERVGGLEKLKDVVDVLMRMPH